jgi:spore germination protein KC
MMYLFGELTAIETLCHLIIISEMEECIISIPSPFDSDSVIDLYVTLDKNTKNDVKFVNGAPLISTEIALNAKILSSEKNSNYFEEDNLKLIEDYANSYISSELEAYLYKISKDYGSDIDLFGRHAVKYFATWDEWLKYNWLDNFKNAFFDVNVDFDVISSYLIS